MPTTRHIDSLRLPWPFDRASGCENQDQSLPSVTAQCRRSSKIPALLNRDQRERSMRIVFTHTGEQAVSLALLLCVFAASPTAQAQDSADAQLATIKQYCSGCHSDKAKIGGISFQGITAGSVAKDPELFEKAVRKLRGHVMPPPGAKQPDSKAVD